MAAILQSLAAAVASRNNSKAAGRPPRRTEQQLMGPEVLRTGLRVVMAAALFVRARSRLGGASSSTSVSGSPADTTDTVNPTVALLASATYWTVMTLVAFAVLTVFGIQVAPASSSAWRCRASGATSAPASSSRSRACSTSARCIVHTRILENTSRTLVTVPNRRLQEALVTNHSRRPQRRVHVDALVSNKATNFAAVAAAGHRRHRRARTSRRGRPQHGQRRHADARIVPDPGQGV